MNNQVKLEDVLFVFGQWTLILKSNKCYALTPGEEVELLDERGRKVCDAFLGKHLNSRNHDISAIEVNGMGNAFNMKRAKYVKPKLLQNKTSPGTPE